MSSSSATPPKAVVDFVAAHSDAEVLDTGKVRCSTTGHECLPQLDVLRAHWEGKTYRKKAALVAYDFEQHAPHLVSHKQSKHLLYCTVTRQPVSRQPSAVEGHVNGKRFKRMLAEREAAQAKRNRAGAGSEGGEEGGDEWDWEEGEEEGEEEAAAAAEEPAKRRRVEAAGGEGEESVEGSEGSDEESDAESDEELQREIGAFKSGRRFWEEEEEAESEEESGDGEDVEEADVEADVGGKGKRANKGKPSKHAPGKQAPGKQAPDKDAPGKDALPFPRGAGKVATGSSRPGGGVHGQAGAGAARKAARRQAYLTNMSGRGGGGRRAGRGAHERGKR